MNDAVKAGDDRQATRPARGEVGKLRTLGCENAGLRTRKARVKPRRPHGTRPALQIAANQQPFVGEIQHILIKEEPLVGSSGMSQRGKSMAIVATHFTLPILSRPCQSLIRISPVTNQQAVRMLK